MSSSLLPKQLLQLAAQRSGGFAFIHLALSLSVAAAAHSTKS